eukprot:1988454-Prorocentrum_lima.AAC.1
MERGWSSLGPNPPRCLHLTCPRKNSDLTICATGVCLLQQALRASSFTLAPGLTLVGWDRGTCATS